MTHRLFVLDAAGDDVAIGRSLGEQSRLGGAVRELAAYYRALPRSLILGPGGGNLEERMILRGLEPAMDLLVRRLEARRPEALRARTRAFMDAAGADVEDARYVNVMDLFQNLVGLAGRGGMLRHARRWTVPAACSTLVAWGTATEGGRLLHGRNFDFPGIGVWDPRPTLCFCAPDDGLRYGYVGTLGADVPGVTAFNEAGIAISAHTRLHRRVRFDARTIIDLGHAIVRQARTLDDAIEIARRQPIASSWGICVSSAKEARAMVIETHGDGVAIVHGAAADHLTCTNRYRHPRTQEDEIMLCAGWACSSDGRESVLTRGVRERARALGALDVARLLGSHEDPEVPGHWRAAGPIPAQACSVQSVVIDLDAAAIHLSVGRAPTSEGPWVSVPIRWGEGPRTIDVRAEPVKLHPPRRHAAYRHFVEATRLSEAASPMEPIQAELSQAAALDPEDASYAFMLGGCAIRDGRWDDALSCMERALGREPNPSVRARMRLWAARAADAAVLPRRAREHRNAIVAASELRLRGVARDASAESRTPLSSATLRRAKIAPEVLDVVVN